MPRSSSVPVMRKEQDGITHSQRSVSFDHHAMDRAWEKSKGKVNFGDFFGDGNLEKQPLVGSYAPAMEFKGSTLIPVILTLIIGQGALLFGIHIGYSSPTSASIKAHASLESKAADLMFSMISLGAILGCLSAAPISDRIGRRMTAIFTTIPFVIGSILMVNSKNFALLSASRFVIGIGVGISSVLVPLYIAEISPSHLRGSLGAANQFFVGFGVVVVNALGIPCSANSDWWKDMLLICLVPAGIMLIGVIFIAVETPRWLLSRGKEESAEKALRFVRGADYNVAGELNDILQAVNRNDDDSEFGIGATKSKSFGQKVKFLLGPALRPFLIGIILQLLQQWSGINAIMFNAASFFSDPTDLSESAQRTAVYGAIAVNSVQVIMGGLTIFSMNRAGRRFFLISSHLGMAIAGIMMGVAYQLQWSSLIRIIIVMVYLAFFAIGVGPMPWLVCAEIYPSSVRELAMSFSTFVNWASAFGVTSSVSAFQQLILPQGVFWFYSAVSILGAVFVYLVLPETKDKSLEEIEQFFLDEY